MSNKNYTDVEEDFGFSFVDEDIEDEKVLLEENRNSLEDRLSRLYNAMEVFLNNLAKNPEKTTIKWPNRAEKVEQFKKKLQDIKEGND